LRAGLFFVQGVGRVELRALVTRPNADAAPLARALASRGLEVMIEPLLEIVPLAGAAIDLDGVQGILATSANGVRAFAADAARRDLPVWAVGDATAAEARKQGFATVESARGDVETLAMLVTARVDPKRGALLHPAGRHVTGDLAARLSARGFEVRRATLYEAHPAQGFSPALRDALSIHAIDLAFFFSPRTAATFVRLAQSAGLGGAGAAIGAYALSEAVADALRPLVWRTMRIAGQPTQDSLLAALDADSASGRAAN
jgi:uroporphyrinogen-III synthase